MRIAWTANGPETIYPDEKKSKSTRSGRGGGQKAENPFDTLGWRLGVSRTSSAALLRRTEMPASFFVRAAIFGAVLLCLVLGQDDLSDYPIKEEQCENFGECLTECVKKLPPNRQFSDIVSDPGC
jgi:hypothetical protein